MGGAIGSAGSAPSGVTFVSHYRARRLGRLPEWLTTIPRATQRICLSNCAFGAPNTTGSRARLRRLARGLINRHCQIGKAARLAGAEIEKAAHFRAIIKPKHHLNTIAYPYEIAQLSTVFIFGIVRLE